MRVLHKRADGSFVVQLNGLPYHVEASDPLFAEVSEMAQGLSLPPEPAPETPVLPRPLPTPLEWMDRIPATRQELLLDALDATPKGRRFQKRLLAAREVNPAHPDVQAGVAMLRAAGVLTAEEASILLSAE